MSQSFASIVLCPLLLSGVGLGLSVEPSFNTGTFGVAGSDAGVASATLNVGQQLGGSIGTALFNHHRHQRGRDLGREPHQPGHCRIADS